MVVMAFRKFALGRQDDDEGQIRRVEVAKLVDGSSHRPCSRREWEQAVKNAHEWKRNHSSNEKEHLGPEEGCFLRAPSLPVHLQNLLAVGMSDKLKRNKDNDYPNMLCSLHQKTSG